MSPLQRPHGPHTVARAGLVALLALLLLPTGAAARGTNVGWPRQLDFTDGAIVVYQPQPESLAGDTLTGRAAFSYQKTGAASPVFGVFWFNGFVVVDRDSNSVSVRDIELTRVRLPRTSADEAESCGRVITSGAAGWDSWGTLAELKAGLAATDKERTSIEGLDNEPPRILFAYERAILVVYDGEPLLEDLAGSRLRRVANTPYAVVFDPSTRTYYLNGANLWYSASDPLGPWTDTERVPEAVRAIVPPDTSAEAQVHGDAPEVITATEPTELISTDGPPLYAPLVGDDLLYVTNTESDVLRDVESQALYVLLAGRWYRGDSPDGPWSFVRADELPACFRSIPATSVKGYLRASVAGTDEAEDAVADAGIPQTAAVHRGQSDLQVSYDGEPEWEYIEGSGLYYCINSDVEVVYADERYYACDQGIWYVADDPYGPWSVSVTRPIGVDDIPPSCPLYHLRYVWIFDYNDDYVYVGYQPGYVGCYPSYGTVVYGTGYRYKPWRRHHYHPWPFTWGLHPRYNPWMARWSFGWSYGTGFLRVGSRWRTTEATVHHHGPPLWFGPGGYRRPLLAPDRSFLHPRNGGGGGGTVAGGGTTAPRDRQPANLYNRPGGSGLVDGKALMPPARLVSHVRTTPAPLPNDVYAGKDGKVYRRESGGDWKVNNGGTWRRATMPAPRERTVEVARPTTPSRTTNPVRPTITRASGGSTGDTPRATRSSEPKVQTRTAAPVEQRSPGDLEREYRARERAAEPAPTRQWTPPSQPARESSPPASAPAPAPTPAPAPSEKPSNQNQSQGNDSKPGGSPRPGR